VRKHPEESRIVTTCPDRRRQMDKASPIEKEDRSLKETGTFFLGAPEAKMTRQIFCA